MQFKKFTLLFLMGIFGLFTTNLFAQDATISADEIQYWVGEGENEVVVALSWCSYTETALAWGYRFNGEATVYQAVSAIADEDYRLTVIGSAPSNITYVDDTYDLTMCPNPNAQWGDPDYDIPMHSVNGLMGQNAMAAEPIHNNDFVKIGGYACGIMSPDWTTIIWTTEIIPATDPNITPEDATIDPADIRYWIGEGQNEVVFIVNWAEPDTALAWGYRFATETVTIKDVMDAIAATDYRFSYDSPNGSWLYDIFFNDGVLDLSLTEPMWVSYLVNGESSWDTFDVKTLVNGDYVKWGDTYCGTLVDPENYIYVWEKEVAAVYPLAEEAKIDPSEILYWVGEGTNEVVYAVNWAEPNKCFAWGYRFNEATITVKDVMDAIKAADGRFDYVVGAWGVDDITFHNSEFNLGITENSYFMYNVNGLYAWYGYDQQTLVNGDFVKFGDVVCGTEIAPWTYVWTQTVEPVSNPTGLNENQYYTLSVYPNPAKGETYVTLENAGLNEVSVYDMQGRLVSKQSFVATAGEKVRFSTEMLNAGVYFVRVSSEDAIQTAKLVVK